MEETQRVRGRAIGAPSQSGILTVGIHPPAVHSPILLTVSLFARQRAFFSQARTLPHTAAASSHLHRLSVDFAHHPTLLLFEEAGVGERLLSHSSLGSWSTPSLSKLAVSAQVGAMLQGSASTCRAYPTTVEYAHQARQTHTHTHTITRHYLIALTRLKLKY